MSKEGKSIGLHVVDPKLECGDDYLTHSEYTKKDITNQYFSWPVIVKLLALNYFWAKSCEGIYFSSNLEMFILYFIDGDFVRANRIPKTLKIIGFNKAQFRNEKKQTKI